jgi:transposase-like protein
LIFAAVAATERWGARYRAIIRLWKNAWEVFIRSWSRTPK